MAKKADLLEKAAELKLDVSEKNTIAEIEAAIAAANDKDVIAQREATVAKAGKRSQKALDEAEAKAEKEARKEAGDTTPQGDVDAAIKKGPAPKVRPLIERRGKAYRKLAEKVEKDKVYSLDEALQLATETSALVLIHARPIKISARQLSCHTAQVKLFALPFLRQKPRLQLLPKQGRTLLARRLSSSCSTKAR